MSNLCVKCGVLICDICQLDFHSDHEYMSTDHLKNDLKSLQQDILRKRSQVLKGIGVSVFLFKFYSYIYCIMHILWFTSHRNHRNKHANYVFFIGLDLLQAFSSRRRQIEEKKEELRKNTSKMMLKLTKILTFRADFLIQIAYKACDDKVQALHEKDNILQGLLDQIEHCSIFVNNALTNSSDNAILYSGKTIIHAMNKIKAQKAEFPNVQIPVHIAIAFGDLNHLRKTIMNLGEVIVDGISLLSRPDTAELQQKMNGMIYFYRN